MMVLVSKLNIATPLQLTSYAQIEYNIKNNQVKQLRHATISSLYVSNLFLEHTACFN
jgi:transcriptional regulator of met regulon